ncbi:MAG: hypothetical protein Q7J54_00995 [Candidatus Woesearchaeota archaeon]|nr:hypothetical protein [Candidatus Woesearchaeota archaeon]
MISKIDLSLQTIGSLFFQQIKDLTAKTCSIEKENALDFQMSKRWSI